MEEHSHGSVAHQRKTPEALRAARTGDGGAAVAPHLRSPLLRLRSHGGAWPLPDLPSPANSDLVGRIVKLVDAKYTADRLFRRGASCFMHPRMVYGAERSITASQFLAGCVLFLGRPSDERFAARVATRWIMGWSWKRSAKNVDPNLLPGILAHLVSDERADLDRAEYAELTWWPALGLVVAHEGKNRIELLRRVRAKTIAGDVAAADYPPPGHIRLYHVGEGQYAEIWAVLEDRWLQRLPWYPLSEVLLRTYGVANPSAWPRDFPPPSNVLAALHGHLDPHLDLQTCVEPVTSNERVDIAMAKLSHMRWKWSRVVTAVVGCFALSLAFYAADLPLIGTALASLLTGAGLALGLPWFSVRKALLDDF